MVVSALDAICCPFVKNFIIDTVQDPRYKFYHALRLKDENGDLHPDSCQGAHPISRRYDQDKTLSCVEIARSR